MARRYSKKHLLWLTPTILVVLLAITLAAGLLMAQQRGWQWQGLGWDDGLVLQRLNWRDDGCVQLTARDIQVRELWPLQLTVARVTVPSCDESGHSSGGRGFSVPFAPPFDVVVQAFRFRDHPALRLAVHHRGARWWLQAKLKGSTLRARFNAQNNRWQVDGRVDIAALRKNYSGSIKIRGKGYWRPGPNKPKARFGGQLRLTGKQLGRAHRGPYGNFNATVTWHDSNWTLDAQLKQPVALGRGWVLQPGQGVRASGTGLTIQQATAVLTAQGPQGHARLTLHSEAGRLGHGRASLVLSHGLKGRIDLSWKNGTLAVEPFSIAGFEGMRVTLDEAVTVPIAAQGHATPALTLHYDEVAIRTAESRLTWGARGIRWRGTLKLYGRWHSYQLSGHWTGMIDDDGLHGEPLVATLDGTDLHLRARLPVKHLWSSDQPVKISLEGYVMDLAFTATVSAAHTDKGWHGRLQAHSRLPQADQGGALDLTGQWQWRNGLVLSSGTQLSMSRMLVDTVLIRPIELTATTPVAISADGIEGRFRLEAAGLTAARWVVPPVQGDIVLDQGRMEADIRIPQWNGTLSVTGTELAGTPSGTFHLRLPLQPAVTRGLGIIARDGVIIANGQWRIGRQPTISARLQAIDVKLDWGSIMASGLQADLAISWRPDDIHISSRQPLTIAKLNTGVPVTDIQLKFDSDLHTWHFRDVSASLLGGRLTAKALTWPSSEYQPVVLAGIDVGRLAALQSKPIVSVSGQIGGTIPVRLRRNGVAIRDGRLKNETSMLLTIEQTKGVRALKESNRMVEFALDTISPLHIKTFLARINMTADGQLKAAMTIKGVNPELERPIVLNYTHQENVYKLLRSLRIGGRIVDAVTGR